MIFGIVMRTIVLLNLIIPLLFKVIPKNKKDKIALKQHKAIIRDLNTFVFTHINSHLA